MSEASSGLRLGFRIGHWLVEPLRGALTAPDGVVRHVEPKVMDVLVLLAERQGEVLTRHELLDAVWSRHVSADQQLTRAVSELRRVLEDDTGAPRFVETVPKRGYRLVAEVSQTLKTRTAIPRPARTRSNKTIAVVAVLIAATVISVVNLIADPPSGNAPEGGMSQATIARSVDASDPSIAVLPFASLGDDAGNEYLSDGLAEEIRNLLAGVPGLKVIGRRSSSLFSTSDGDYRSIARTLGVTRLLEGTVQMSEERVRIGVQLIDASDGTVIWSDVFVQPVDDIFVLQEDVAKSVLNALEMYVANYPVRGQPTNNADAYGLFLKARQALNVQYTLPAEIALKQAVTLDPQFAEAWELLAFAYWVEPRPERESAETMRLVREAATSALSIEPERAFARALLYESGSDNYSLPEAISAYIMAARAQPNEPSILRVLSWHLIITGYFEQALDVTTKMVQIDPLSSMSYIRHCVALNALGRISEAQAALETAHHLDPGALTWYLGELHIANGNDDRAISLFEQELLSLGMERSDWVREVVTTGRHPDKGAAGLDAGISAVLNSFEPDVADSIAPQLERWYLLLGHLDPYLELILEVSPGAAGWSDTEMHIWYGMAYRSLGFTAHPDYIEIARRLGHIDVWERLGAPDHCKKGGNGWTCT